MSPFLYPPPDVKQPVAIYNDGGGLVDAYIAQARKYRLEKRRVEIRGSCRSACIMALSVPTVCVAPGAVVKAHNAYEQSTGTIRPDVTDMMLSELPYRIRVRLDGKIKTFYSTEATLDYDDLRSLGINDCNSKTVKTVAKDKEEPLKIKIMNPFGGLFKFFSGASR